MFSVSKRAFDDIHPDLYSSFPKYEPISADCNAEMEVSSLNAEIFG